jgi:hypothetical protein
MQKEWVLVTSDGPQLRDALVAVRGLAAGGYRPAIAVSCGFSLASSSRHCLHRIDIPHHEHPGYVPAIQEEMRRLPYLTVLPASEVALLALGVPVRDLVDKAKVEELGRAVGIPSPPGRVFSSGEELLAAAHELEYPVIVKPAVHTYHATRVESPAGLAKAVLKEGAVMVQPYLNDSLHAVSGVLWKGTLVAAVHERWFRIWRFHSGVATAAETVAPDEELEDRLTRLMAGYDGYFHAQFAGPYLLDINLRVHTSHPLSVAAGVNLIGLYCDLLRGDDVPTVRGRPGVFFRWIEGDVRHVAKAVRLGAMTPRQALSALRPRRGTVHSTESLSDPGPMISRLGYLSRQVAARAMGRAG